MKVGRNKQGRFIKGYEQCKGENHPNWKGGKVIKKCLKCGKEFKSKLHAKRKYCSLQCFNIARTLNLTKICTGCKKIFKVNSNFRLKEVKFCSCKCAGESLKKRYIGSGGPCWKGGVYTSTSGYIRIYSPNHPHKDIKGYVLRSRLVMEKHLGRFLNPIEEIHHINGIRNDDRIENLKLFDTGNEHDSFHSKLNFPKGSIFGINKKLITCPNSPTTV